MPTLTIQPGTDTTTGTCDCCGKRSRVVRGFVYSNNDAYAVYFIHWTEGHVSEAGARWNIVIGAWGEDAVPEQRFVAQLRYMSGDEGGFRVEDAEEDTAASLASNLLKREDIIGRPLAKQIFDICDAIYLQEERLQELKC